MLETLRRWEDARDSGFITPEIKAELRKTDIEHTLLIDENGDFELASWYHLHDVLGGDDRASVFLFERGGKTCAAIWSNTGSDKISLPIGKESVSYVETFGSAETPVVRNGEDIVIPIGKRRYLITELSREELAKIFEKAKFI